MKLSQDYWAQKEKTKEWKVSNENFDLEALYFDFFSAEKQKQNFKSLFDRIQRLKIQ